MTDEAALPPPPAYPTFEEVEHSVYGFDCAEWEDIPYPTGPDWFTDEERSRRNEAADKYHQRGGTPTGWSRYLELGFFGYEDCSEFEAVWNNFDTNPLAVHKAIWYQFMYHLDREFDIPEKLQAWATNYSHLYLAHYDPKSLQIDTYATLHEWKIFEEKTNEMNDSDDSSEGWIDVPGRGRRRNTSPPATADRFQDLPNLQKQQDIPARQASKELHNQRKQLKSYKKTMKPASKLPKVSTVREEDEEDDLMEEDITLESSKGDHTRWSAAPPKLPSFPNLAVNDGTHRVTIKWKPSGGITQYEHDKHNLNTAIQEILTALFDDDDGMLYRWESEDLKASALVSKMTGSEIRDYVSPAITLIKSTSHIVMGIRFRFTANPIKWKTTDTKRALLKDRQIEIKISNSKSTSGKMVTAGYVLLKAPNTTSTHRYTQFLRSKVPEATPYFDIERFRKTPMDQAIPHLVIQCGESHVTPVCQALSKVLRGNGMARFLPRYAFSAMTDTQVSNQFLFHEKWLHSIKALPLAPVIFHLDQERIEYCDDGGIIQRSTREWVATLTLPDGTPALCDVVNGTKEKKAMFLVPAHYFKQTKEELRLYKMRISPPCHREARFRDCVLDLPDEIHIKTGADLNVSFMDNLLAADVWQKSPHYPSKSRPQSTTSEKHNYLKDNKTTKHNVWAVQRNKPQHTSSVRQVDQQQDGDDGSAGNHAGQKNSGTIDDLSTASTQSLTMESESPYFAKLRDLEASTKEKLKTLEVNGRASAKKLDSLEEKFNKFADNTSTKIATVQLDMRAMATQLEASISTQKDISSSLTKIQKNTEGQFNQIGDHLVKSSENVNSLTTSVANIRDEIGKLFGMMQQDIESRHKAPSEIAWRPEITQPHGADLHHKGNGALVQGTSSNDSITSTHSHKSFESMATSSDSSSASKASESTLRSPPPKRNRQGGTVSESHQVAEDRSIDSIECSFTGDTTLEADDDRSSQGDISTNLIAMFENASTEASTDISSEQQQMASAATTPRHSNGTLLQSQNQGQTNPSDIAPLNPQYTFDTGSAGADET